MKTGRPRKLNNPVTVTIMMEEKALREIDDLKGKHSRGQFISVLIITDNLKTNKILDLNDKVQILEAKIKTLSIEKEENMTESFRKTIYSHFRVYAADYIEDKMGAPAKKLWCEKLNCKATELKNLLW